MVKLDNKRSATEGYKTHKNLQLATKSPKAPTPKTRRSQPTSPTGCRVEDVLGSRIVEELLLKEVCTALHLIIFVICFDTGLKAMSTLNVLSKSQGKVCK